MNKKVACLFSVFFIIASSVIVPPISAQISTPQLATIPLTVTLSVESADMSGTAFAGQWVELWQNGELQEDFTPFLADVESGTEYQVFIYDDPDEGKFFDHWEDSSTNPTRTITPLSDTTLTAFFQTDSADTSAVSLLVESADMSGESFEGMWIEIWQNDVIIQEGPTPFSTLVESGINYKVFANNFEDMIFDHWEDGSTDPQRAFAIDGDTTFTAFYQTDSTPANNAPIANDDSITTDEDVPIDVDAMANDNFSGTGLFFVSSVTEPSNGVAVINDDNTVTYLPNQDFFGSDSFQYTVSNPDGLVRDSAIVFVTVNPVNDPPVAVDDFITTSEDTAASFFAEQNDFDVDGDEIFVASVEQVANGSAEISENGAIVYTSNTDFNGQDSFTYVLSDVNGATDIGTVSAMVNPVNDAPIAADDSAQTSINQSVAIDVLANDSDTDDDSLNVTSTSTPSNGTATINANNTVSYSPDQDFTGDDSFEYTVSDGNGSSDSATVTITINSINAPQSPDSPTGLTANPVRSSQINLNWTAPSNDGGSIITGYQIERSEDNGATWTVLVLNTNSASTTYSDTELSSSTTYSYRVFAINVVGKSQPSNTASATLDASSGSAVIATISLEPAFPNGVAVNPSTNMIYVTQYDGNEIFVIDGTTNTLIANVTVGSGSDAIATNPNTNKIYVSTRNDGLVVVDGESNTVVTKLLVGEENRGVGVNPNTNKIYVGSLSGKVFVINGSTNTVITSAPASPNGDVADIAVNPVTNMIYVSIDHSNVLDVIDGETDTVIDSIGVASHSGNIAVNPDTNRIYVVSLGTSFRDPKIFVIDGTANTIISTITESFGNIEVNPNTNKIYIINSSNERVDVLDGTTNTIVATLPVGNPSSLDVNPVTNKVYVSNFYDNTVTVLQGVE